MLLVVFGDRLRSQVLELSHQLILFLDLSKPRIESALNVILDRVHHSLDFFLVVLGLLEDEAELPQLINTDNLIKVDLDLL